MEELLAVARGDRPADVVLRGGRVVDVYGGEVVEGDVAIAEGRIASVGPARDGAEVVDLDGAFVAPAFIDGHMHVESSLLGPFELARTTCVRGTGTIVSDPHEVANVLGVDGVRWMVDAARDAPAEVLFTAPSCVPASPLATAGAALGPAEVVEMLALDGVVGLGEVMSVGEVIAGDASVMAKIGAAGRLQVDGHAPAVTGDALQAYAAAGPRTDHESTTVAEAREKLRLGMWLMMRDGTPTRDLAALLGLVTERNARRFLMVTDDISSIDLLERGHLDHHLRAAVAAGVDPVLAIRMVTLNAAECYRLHDRGGLAPGRRADVVVLEDLKEFRALRTLHGGALVASNGVCHVAPRTPPALPPTMRPDLDAFEPSPVVTSTRSAAIEVTDGAIVTGRADVETPVRDGRLVADTARDLVKLCVVERHTASGRAGVALARGIGLVRGALASSVAHDHHNLVLAGVDDDDLRLAARVVTEQGGGFAVVADGSVLAALELPLAGLMSPQDAETVAAGHRHAIGAARALGTRLADPFMTLSFLGLEVVPSLKLTDLGLVDVEAGALL
jgi:adenine deaminase